MSREPQRNINFYPRRPFSPRILSVENMPAESNKLFTI